MVDAIVAPSILAYDNCDLASGVSIIEGSGAEWIHVDVMDGHFVDNISFGPKLVSDLRRRTDLFLDIHLMLEYPDRFVKRFAQAGAGAITVHHEATCDIGKQLQIIRECGCLCGISVCLGMVFDPELVRCADIVLVMGVPPGLCGQKFTAEARDRVLQLRDFRDGNGLRYKISVDGGVNAEIARDLISIGADVIVSGSAFFSDPSAFRFHSH
ncbi:MAG: ribulose-phosphate 3-epimerase [Puniceicoccales bacterium]|jgi:ribulose-phosphate 3-epimerase|nr:ribulose-phosphate 3-epimerase [Puniceicoccales bacterium]